jgi:hypothetical protein
MKEPGTVGELSHVGGSVIQEPTGGVVHLTEEKVFAHLSDEVKTECHRWVLDTGATNHMTGCRSAFCGEVWRRINGVDQGIGDNSIHRQAWRALCICGSVLHSQAEYQHHQRGTT